MKKANTTLFKALVALIICILSNILATSGAVGFGGATWITVVVTLPSLIIFSFTYAWKYMSGLAKKVGEFIGINCQLEVTMKRRASSLYNL